jgi:E3 ubiquitin-protein ligase TRIP12
MLCMGSEDTLGGIPLHSIVPELVRLLSQDHSGPEVMLLACRALTQLIDTLPASASVLVHHDAVPTLCAKLLSIEYIDVAEQALQVLPPCPRPSAHVALR